MATALTLSLVPIALLIGLGFWLRTTGFIGDDFWPHAERLGYYVLLPALFFHSLATAELGELPVRLMISVLVSSTIAVSAIMVMARRLFSVDDPAFTSLFQGSVRFNNYVGVSAAAGIFGAQGIAIAAVANAAIVPTVNILCVLVFARYGAGSRATFAGVLRQLIFNPLIMACALGISVQASGLAIPPGIEPALKTLG